MIECKLKLILTRICIILVLGCFGSLPILSQNFSYFKKLSKQDGLSQSSVFAISEDDDGFLWFGTRDGLNKYDGYKFSVYRKQEEGNGPAGNDIRYLFSDTIDRKLWIGTLEGLSYLDLNSYAFTSFNHDPDIPNSLASDHISSIYRDKEDRIWIGTSKGLNLFDPQTATFKLFKIQGPENANSINTIYSDHVGTLWIGTREGLYHLDTENFEIVRKDIDIGLQGTNITSLVSSRDKGLWIATADGGLTLMNTNEDIIAEYKNSPLDDRSLSHNNIRSLCIDKKNRLWVGTFDGLNLFNENSKDFTVFKNSRAVDNSLTDNSIKHIYTDTKGSIWIGTYYGGVNHLDEGYNQFKNYVYSPYSQGLSAPVVSSFVEDEKGNLWIGTEGGGLNYYDAKKNTYKSFKATLKSNSISGNNVKQLELDGNDLWIGHFSNGLDRLDLTNGSFKNYSMKNGLSNDNVYDILIEEDKLWLGTYAGGLNILDKNTGEVELYQNSVEDSLSLSSNFIRVIFKTSQDEIWLGTSKGINRVEKVENGSKLRFHTYLENRKIYSIQEDSEGILWVGTISNGLIKFDPKTEKIRHFTTTDGLAGNTVFGILEDSKRNLWMSTNNGISRFSKDDLQFINFDNSNGLNNSEFNFNAYAKTESGDLLFGGISGYTRFDPESIIINEFVPPVVLTGVHQNNKMLNFEKNINQLEKLTFKYNEANFTLDFAALDYSNPDNNYYSYKLEGLDNDWNFSIGQPSATYTIQRNGKYIFKLRGGNSSGIWNDEVKELAIEVLPPPWRTWWAYLLYLLLSVGAFLALLRYVRLRDSYELELKEKQQKEELHRLKLNFFTNVAHEFRTPLTLIIGPLEDLIKNMKEYAPEKIKSMLLKINDNSQRMLNLVNQLMIFRKMEAGHEQLKVQEVELKAYVQSVFTLFEDHAKLLDIQYRIHLPTSEVSAYIDVRKLEKVLNNLLSNAFKFTPHEGTIELRIEERTDVINIIVSDTGQGISKELHEQIFQRFYEKNPGQSSNLIKGTGIGLALSKELVELHKGSLTVESQEGEGARFTITLRKGNAHFDKAELVTEDLQTITGEIANSEIYKAKDKKRKLVSDSNLKLLIVDDNEEVLQYLISIFDGRHKILTAGNGREGLDKSIEYQPDLIISDVMMPEMDGFEFCNLIRSNLETSHIPFILLTARTMLNDKLTGLKSGANDFISKPFHPDELLMKVENMLIHRSKIQNQLKEKEYNPSELEFTSADEQFLQNLITLVEKNIDNPEFKIEQFAHELAVSRALLFTKIKAMTDMTPKNFLKSFRMKRAIQLLESGKLNVHEVSYMVGYKDPKYFSKVFQKEFGKNPSEYTVAFRV